jgi:hypothetical protein
VFACCEFGLLVALGIVDDSADTMFSWGEVTLCVILHSARKRLGALRRLYWTIPPTFRMDNCRRAIFLNAP